MNTPQKKTRIRDSKKALFLAFGLVQLNIILFASIFSGIAAAEFLNVLLFLTTAYFATEGSVDVTRAITELKATKATVEAETTQVAVVAEAKAKEDCEEQRA